MKVKAKLVKATKLPADVKVTEWDVFLTIDRETHKLARYWDDKKQFEKRIIKLVMQAGGSTSDWVRILGLVSQALHKAK